METWIWVPASDWLFDSDKEPSLDYLMSLWHKGEELEDVCLRYYEMAEDQGIGIDGSLKDAIIDYARKLDDVPEYILSRMGE